MSDAGDLPSTSTADSVTVASRIPFAELAGFLEKVQKKHGTDGKRQMFREFLEKWREFHKQLHKNNLDTKDNFYPVLRLLLPQLERERVAYGIKEHTLAKLYIEILGLAKESTDAKKLLNYRAPTAKQEAGDFASVAYFVLRNRCPEKGSLSIQDVNTCLDGIAASNAAKKKDVVKKNLMHLLRNTSALEQKWLVRMIMKDMKSGLSQVSIFHAFHPDAEDFFNVTNNLSKLCADLRDPSVRMNEVGISVFSAFSPMLGMRANLNQVEKLMEHKPFYIETKLDGERMQLHKEGNDYKYFSRRSHDYSRSFGETPDDGSLTPYITNCFKRNVRNCILDGEMLAYNPDTKTFMTKGENFDIKTLKDDEDLQVCYCVFDILLYNDKKLANLPLHERVEYIKEVFTPVEGRLHIVERREASSKQEVVTALNDAIDNREEGIMIKNPNTTYLPDRRKGSGWLKIKPEYVDNLMDELDLLVVGGFFGKGIRSQMVSHFLLAVAEPPEVPGEHPVKFIAFAKVGSGYTLKELYDFNQRLLPHLKVFKKENPPSFLQFTKEKPDMYVKPQHSFILQVKATEINSSTSYPTGCTLRFPRVEKVREDREWHQCMTTDELENLRQASEGKLATKYAGLEGDEDVPSKKRKVATRTAKPVGVAARFMAADVSEVTKVSEMFAEREFCVINGPPSHSKTELEKKIVEYGGQVVQNPGYETFCVLADKVNLKVRNIISCDIYDVVRTEWLLTCLEEKKCLPWLPSHMIHVSPETKEQFSLLYDRHGDSYTEDVDAEKLKEIFDKVGQEGDYHMLDSEAIAELEQKYFPGESPLGLFRLCKVYMDSTLIISDQSTHIKDCSLDLVAMEMRFYGATVSPKMADDITHVVLDHSDKTRLPSYKKLLRQRRSKFHLVSPEWVHACIEAGKMLSERRFELGLPAD
ncbi:DNA ligase 4-like [Acanthaster planci]|uniref:DNA ligase n=1 Tax=Acanthaster planci TaxID=133434 RepID=A0A8B7ZHV0_ACAPL|nr:DNA ligase 4-like [Acanthaster planci]